jgi:hypothetical protein
MAVGGYFSLQKPLRYLHLESAFPLRMMDPEKSRYPLQDRHFRDTPPTSRYHQTRTPSAMLHLGSALLVVETAESTTTVSLATEGLSAIYTGVSPSNYCKIRVNAC